VKRTILLLLAVLVTLGAFAPALAAAALPQPSEDFFVLDQANVLSEETEDLIFFANQRMAKVAKNEIVVVTVDTTGDYSIDDYAYALINKWKVNGEGAMVVLAIGDDDYYTIPGELLEATLKSSVIIDLQDEYLEPDFAAKDYDAGVRKYFTALFDRVAADANVNVRAADGAADYQAWLSEGDEEEAPVMQAERSVTPSSSGSAPSRKEGSDISMGLIFVVLIFIVVFALFALGRRRPRNTGYYETTTYTRPSSDSGFTRGFIMGSLLNDRDRRPPAGPPPRSSSPGHSYSSSSRSSGFGGATRSSGSFSSGRSSSFGSSSRSSSRSGGFGGASRSRSSSSGSRGGGAGRGGKR